MSDTAVEISASAKQAFMTRRAFMETSVTVAGGAALTIMPIYSGGMVFTASATQMTGPGAPVLTFDSYFTGWPIYDLNGHAEPYEPPAEHQPGAALAAMSDEEFHRHYMYF